MVGRGGLEPPTSRLSGVRSNHLSYRPNALQKIEVCSARPVLTFPVFSVVEPLANRLDDWRTKDPRLHHDEAQPRNGGA